MRTFLLFEWTLVRINAIVPVCTTFRRAEELARPSRSESGESFKFTFGPVVVVRVVICWTEVAAGFEVVLGAGRVDRFEALAGL